MPRFILELPTHFCSNSYITAVSSEITFLLLEGYPFKLSLLMAISVKLWKYIWECRFLGRNFSSSVPWLPLFLFRSELLVLLSLLWRIYFFLLRMFLRFSLWLSLFSFSVSCLNVYFFYLSGLGFIASLESVAFVLIAESSHPLTLQYCLSPILASLFSL